MLHTMQMTNSVYLYLNLSLTFRNSIFQCGSQCFVAIFQLYLSAFRTARHMLHCMLSGRLIPLQRGSSFHPICCPQLSSISDRLLACFCISFPLHSCCSYPILLQCVPICCHYDSICCQCVVVCLQSYRSGVVENLIADAGLVNCDLNHLVDFRDRDHATNDMVLAMLTGRDEQS